MTEKRKEILLIEDEKSHAELMLRSFEPYSSRLVLKVVESLREAMESLKKSIPALVITDLFLPDGRGTELLPVDDNDPRFPVVVMTSQGDEQAATEAIKKGALDYVVKSETTLTMLPRVAERAIREWSHIEERRRVEKALTESEEKLRSIISTVPDIIYRLDSKGKITFITHAVKDYGYSPEELIGKNIVDLIHPDDREKARYKIIERRTGDRSTKSLEVRLLTNDGGGVPFEMKTTVIENEPVFLISAEGIYATEKPSSRSFTGTQGIARDITERKRFEEALLESKEKYKLITENATEGIYQVDVSGNFVFTNETFDSIFGYQREELLGRHYSELIPEARLSEANKILGAVNSSSPHRGEFMMKHKLGHEFPGYFSVSALLKGRTTVGFTGILEDITERKQMEEKKSKLKVQLLETQRMEAISTLAGGIAHDFNNALVGITGNVELLQMHLPPDRKIEKYTAKMKSSAQRMARLTDQLLAYAGGGKYQPEFISLDEVVKDTLALIQHLINPSICIKSDFPQELWKVEADAGQMQMVLSAILVNALEAIVDEGEIRVNTRNEILDQAYLKYNQDLSAGRYVFLTVEDNGKGMSEETKNKMFEPFFTTKLQGRGLGMAAAEGVVVNHGGALTVYSEAGQGTVVNLILPAVESLEEEFEDTSVERDQGPKTIMVIEDEEMVMEVSLAMLQKMGYCVIEARTGHEAIKMAQSFDGVIDLALLDIGLPDMRGDKTFSLIKKARPDMKVIVCSGYSIDGPAREILNAGAQVFIQKPFSMATLGTKLKEVLGGN